MKCVVSFVLVLCVMGSSLVAQTEEKKSTRAIKTGDITKAMDAFLVADDKDAFSQKFLIPIFHATEAVMFKQLPDAPKLASEMAQSLYYIYDYPCKELTDTAARAFLTRPDLFQASFDAIDPDQRAKAVGAIIPAWGELRNNLQADPQTDSATRDKINYLDNMVQSLKIKYPDYVPKRWL